MKKDKYTYNKFTLQFYNLSIESIYREYILKKTLIFCQIAWGIVIFLGSAFALLDNQVFKEKSNIVLLARIIIISLSFIILGTTFTKQLRKYQQLNSFLIIMIIGFFCIFLIFISDPLAFTPYFTGLFFAFTGMFATTGSGFKYSVIALLTILVSFEIAIGMFSPISPAIFLVYTFFLFGMILIFIFMGYFVENISRQNFIVSAKLQDSLDEVKMLSGMFPICAHCKKIRDDDGYWQQVEVYIKEHSEAEFSHSLCPTCLTELYSKEKWFKNYHSNQEPIN